MPSLDPIDPSDAAPDVVLERQTSRPDGHRGGFRLSLRTRSILGGVAVLLGSVGVGVQVTSQDDLDPRFRSCIEAKAEGYGTYRDGKDPEYAWYRDADDDGVVCD
jgi:hypothetical protein